MEKSQDNKQTFLHGAALLAGATIVVKLIGAPFKIVLKHIIGNAGFSYFNTAYDIYNVLLMISTAGLPVAMSRMIAKADSQGRYNQLRRIFRTALVMFFLLGAVGTVLMCAFPRRLARAIGQNEAWYAIAALGPSSLLLCLTSAFRGFFQGQGNMRPTSLSQVLEASCKLVIGLGLSIFLVRAYGDIPLAAGGAILGVSVGALAAALFTGLSCARAKARLPRSGDIPECYGKTARDLLAIAVPITIGAAGLQIINLIDTTLTLHRLQDACGYSEIAASELKGIYNFAQTIFNLPVSLVVPLTVSIIPAITAQMTGGHPDRVRATEESAVRVLGLIILPCALGLFALARPIMALLGGYQGEELSTAAGLMAILGLSVVANGVVLLTNAIMQAHGHQGLPVLNMLAGGLVKIGVGYVLVGNPRINILGAPVGTLCCFAAIAALNLFAMGKTVDSAPRVLRNLGRPFLASAVMGLLCYGAYRVLAHFVSSRILLCMVPLVLGVLCYGWIVLKMGILTYEDCILLPKGEKIAKILKISEK